MGTLYYIRSSKDAARFYAVAATGPCAVLRCEYKAGTFHKQPCRHVREVVAAVVAGEARPAKLKQAA